MCLSALCSALCCASSACCRGCCCALDKCGIPAKNFPKVTYLLTDFSFMILAIILMYAFKPLFREQDWLTCPENSGGDEECFGVAVIMRMSFTLFIYHLVILLAICPRAKCS